MQTRNTSTEEQNTGELGLEGIIAAREDPRDDKSKKIIDVGKLPPLWAKDTGEGSGIGCHFLSDAST